MHWAEDENEGRKKTQIVKAPKISPIEVVVKKINFLNDPKSFIKH
jgi:hypothetical protein